MISKYKALACVLICAVCILFLFCRHYLAEYISNSIVAGIEQTTAAKQSKLCLDILAPGLCFPFGLHADTIQASWQIQPNHDPIQVELARFKSTLNIKPLFSKRIECSFSAGIWQGTLTGLARIKNLELDHLSMVFHFTGLDPQKLIEILKLNDLSCTGPVSGTIHTSMTGGRVENWKADITVKNINLKWAKAIPGLEKSYFSTAMICCEQTGQDPIQITACKITGEEADIQLSGEIRQAAYFIKSKLNLAVKILVSSQDTAHSKDIANLKASQPTEASSDTHSINFILTGTLKNPNLKLTGLPEPLSDTRQPVTKVNKPAHTKDSQPGTLTSREKISRQTDNTCNDFSLLGTVTGNGIEPMAIIKKKSGKLERLYAIGDLVDTAEIMMIMRRQVVLQVNGEQTVLSMTDTDKRDSPAIASGKKAGNYARKISLTSKEMGGMINNLDSLSKQIRFKPYSQNNKARGYRISNLGKGSILYKKLGLRPKDIVTEINGQPLDSLENITNLYDQFTKQGLDSTVEVKIQRNGRPTVLEYEIN